MQNSKQSALAALAARLVECYYDLEDDYDTAPALDLCNHALALARRAQEPRDLAHALLALASVPRVYKIDDAAAERALQDQRRALLEEALPLFRHSDDPDGTAECLRRLASCMPASQAYGLLEQSLKIAKAINPTYCRLCYIAEALVCLVNMVLDRHAEPRCQERALALIRRTIKAAKKEGTEEALAAELSEWAQFDNCGSWEFQETRDEAVWTFFCLGRSWAELLADVGCTPNDPDLMAWESREPHPSLQEALTAGCRFYIPPHQLQPDDIDADIRLAVRCLNHSGWLWTAASRAGDLGGNEQNPQEPQNPQDASARARRSHGPYLDLVCREEHMIHALELIRSTLSVPVSQIDETNKTDETDETDEQGVSGYYRVDLVLEPSVDLPGGTEQPESDESEPKVSPPSGSGWAQFRVRYCVRCPQEYQMAIEAMEVLAAKAVIALPPCRHTPDFPHASEPLTHSCTAT